MLKHVKIYLDEKIYFYVKKIMCQSPKGENSYRKRRCYKIADMYVLSNQQKLNARFAVLKSTLTLYMRYSRFTCV